MDSFGGMKSTSAPQSNAPQTAMQVLQERLEKLVENFNLNAQRLERSIDRLRGSSPEKESAGQPRAVPNGIFGVIAERLDDLSGLAGLQSALLDRLDTLV